MIHVSDISHVASFWNSCMARIIQCSQEQELVWAICMLPVLCHQLLPDIDPIIILPHTPSAIVGSRWHVSPKRWYLSTKQHGFISQKVTFFIAAVMRMLKFAKPFFGQPNFYHVHDVALWVPFAYPIKYAALLHVCCLIHRGHSLLTAYW
jgi:hypothetical protein